MSDFLVNKDETNYNAYLAGLLNSFLMEDLSLFRGERRELAKRQMPLGHKDRKMS
jgi:hypothetical protein